MRKKLLTCLLMVVCVAGLFVACDDDGDDKTVNVGYSGADISGNVELVRDAETKKAVLNVTSDKAWDLFAGTTAEDIDLNAPLLSGAGKGSFDVNLDADQRAVLMFKNADGQALLSEKVLPVNGYNFRDMGGIKTTDGKYVRWGKLFRTDEMYKLTPDDLKYLESSGLKTVVDFRTDTEKEGGFGGIMPESYDVLPSSVKEAKNLPINAGNIFSDEILGQIKGGATQDDMAQVMINSYIEMVTVDDYVAQYKEFFRLLQDENSLPLSFHCSAGKDRTGVAAMLILTALGVDKTTIMADYMLSAKLVEPKYAAYVKMIGIIAPLVTVDEQYLNAAYNKIEEKYGSVTTFLTDALGVDIQKMKDMYLY